MVLHLLFFLHYGWATSHFLLGCYTFWSTHLEIKLLQPHGCMTVEQCGHGTSKLLCCTLELGFTSLCSLSSSRSMKFSFTYLYHIPRGEKNPLSSSEMLGFVLTANSHRDVAKPQLFPSACAKTDLCQESSRMNQISENLLWPSFKNIWQRLGLALNSVAWIRILCCRREYKPNSNSGPRQAKTSPHKTALHLLHLHPAPGKPSSGENLTVTVCKGALDLTQGIPVRFYRIVFIAVYCRMKH